ncbi:helix-turn-helix domain-containing protein [Paenibacillus solani]|uniref:helix-turn-helix domain-containing protein n=1 Tax=Paenibacillus solani TaxID=1705565 RepID=UPI003D2B6DF1
MVMTATIREQIEGFLHKNELTINRFAEISEVNSGTLSNILNGNRPISMHQLDRITEAMSLEEGYFYDLYINECIFHATPDWRRLGPFLHRCAELGKLDCLDQCVRLTMDNTSYAPLLFDTAEHFFKEGKREAAVLLYKSVAESERFQHSERLALCQYRLFTLELSDDQEANLQAAVYFEPFVDRLDEMYQLEALVKLINVNSSLHRLNKMNELAEKMGNRSMIQYKQRNFLNYEVDHPKHSLVFYILYSYLIKAKFYCENGDYEDALHYVSLYSDPNFVSEPSVEELKIITQFKEWGIANRYLYQLMAGQVEVLGDYVEYVSTREDEIFPALCQIMIVANRYDLDVDQILDRFKDYLVYREQKNHMVKINKQVTLDRFTRLLAEMGIYYLNKRDIDRGLHYLLESLSNSVIINSSKGMLRCIGLFEQYRSASTPETEEKFNNLVSEVYRLNEKKIGLSVSYL